MSCEHSVLFDDPILFAICNLMDKHRGHHVIIDGSALMLREGVAVSCETCRTEKLTKEKQTAMSESRTCVQHCYCKEVTVDRKQHKQCCNCGNRQDIPDKPTRPGGQMG